MSLFCRNSQPSSFQNHMVKNQATSNKNCKKSFCNHTNVQNILLSEPCLVLLVHHPHPHPHPHPLPPSQTRDQRHGCQTSFIEWPPASATTSKSCFGRVSRRAEQGTKLKMTYAKTLTSKSQVDHICGSKGAEKITNFRMRLITDLPAKVQSSRAPRRSHIVWDVGATPDIQPEMREHPVRFQAILFPETPKKTVESQNFTTHLQRQKPTNIKPYNHVVSAVKRLIGAWWLPKQQIRLHEYLHGHESGQQSWNSMLVQHQLQRQLQWHSAEIEWPQGLFENKMMPVCSRTSIFTRKLICKKICQVTTKML